MYNADGRLRPAYKDNWLDRHSKRERAAMKQRGKLAAWCSCVGIEMEEKYCEIAAKRLEQEVFQFAD